MKHQATHETVVVSRLRPRWIYPVSRAVQCEDLALKKGEHRDGNERPTGAPSTTKEREIASIVSDLESVILRLDRMGLSLAAARASDALDFVKKS